MHTTYNISVIHKIYENCEYASDNKQILIIRSYMCELKYLSVNAYGWTSDTKLFFACKVPNILIFFLHKPQCHLL